jgi:hypothetical protein
MTAGATMAILRQQGMDKRLMARGDHDRMDGTA